MAYFPEDNKISFASAAMKAGISLPYAFLEFEYYRTSAINDFETERRGRLICIRRLPMGSNE